MPKSSRIKKYLVSASLIATLVVVILSVTAPSAEANPIAAVAGWVAGAMLLPTVNAILGFLFYVLLTIAGFLLSLAGSLLSVSMYMTTHLGFFIDKSSAIYIVWGIIRDLSSILLIFFILYAAIQKIIGQQSASYGTMIKQIIIVGVLINFSFFFTRVMIDTSNIVSLQFYNAMAPGNANAESKIKETNGTISEMVTILLSSGGMSDAIMGQINITGWWSKNAKNFLSSKASLESSSVDMLNMVLVASGGIIVSGMTTLMLISVAAIAILRLAMLIFLLAFSPIWIASMAMPSLKELSKKWTGPFYAQLVFLPTYLAFLYVALKVITSLNLTSVTATGSDTGIGNAINLFVGFGIVIVMLMIPMAAAVAVTSAVGGDSGLIQKVANGARSYARTAATRGTQKAWTNTGGRVASTLAKSETLKDLAGKKGIFGDLGRLTLKGARGATGDYEKKLAAQVKSRTDFAESLGYDQNKMSAEQKTLRTAEQELAQLKATGGTAAAIDAKKANIKDAKARIETLTNKRQLAYTDTLYDHVYHADSVAKAKIKLPIEEKRLTKAKESLDETKADIKQLQNAIRNNPAGTGNINIPGIGAATTVQEARLDELNSEMLKHVTSLNGIQDNIDNLKLIS